MKINENSANDVLGGTQNNSTQATGLSSTASSGRSNETNDEDTNSIEEEDVDMSFKGPINACYYNAFNFRGRAKRAEYWYFTLYLFLVSFVSVIFMLFVPLAVILFALFWLVNLVPSFAVTFRRLHDVNLGIGTFLSYFFIQLGLSLSAYLLPEYASVMSLGSCVLNVCWVVLMARKGTDGPNDYDE